MANNLPLKLVTIALFLAIEVVLMGGFTRITDSGLGCPDWPGCFGKMVMTTDTEMLLYLQERYPEIHVAAHKGWIEMIHRYIAGILGLLIVALAYLGYREKEKTPNYPYLLSLILLGIGSCSGRVWRIYGDVEACPKYCDASLNGWTHHRIDLDVFEAPTQTSRKR